MNLNLTLILTLFSCLMMKVSFGGNKIKNVNFKNLNTTGELHLVFDKKVDEVLNLQVEKNVISLNLKNTTITASDIPSRVSFATETTKDTILELDQKGNNALLNLRFPFNIEQKENKIHLSKNSRELTIKFPKVRIAEPVVKEVKKDSVVQAKLDESYLDDLLASEKQKKNQQVLKTQKQDTKVKSFLDEDTDDVSTTKASTEKKEPSFSFMSYAGKFVAFLGGVLLLFYVIVNLFKKGVVSRGKMGFLNSSNLIEILSTTYIAPKKSVLMVKAHNQVFLVSNTDQGINFLSEITDTAGLFKKGEKELTGTNFDTDLNDVNSNMIEDRITLKEDITKSTPVAMKSKFSEQLKNKVKGLKPLN